MIVLQFFTENTHTQRILVICLCPKSFLRAQEFILLMEREESMTFNLLKRYEVVSQSQFY